jgi:hypothetical protein
MTKNGLNELIPYFGAMDSTAKTGCGKMTLEASIKMTEFANPAEVSGHVNDPPAEQEAAGRSLVGNEDDYFGH